MQKVQTFENRCKKKSCRTGSFLTENTEKVSYLIISLDYQPGGLKNRDETQTLYYDASNLKTRNFVAVHTLSSTVSCHQKIDGRPANPC